MADYITEELLDDGVKAMKQTIIKSAKRLNNEKIEVKLEVKGVDKTIEVDTVVVAIGRDVNPETLGVASAGICVNDSGKI